MCRGRPSLRRHCRPAPVDREQGEAERRERRASAVRAVPSPRRAQGNGVCRARGCCKIPPRVRRTRGSFADEPPRPALHDRPRDVQHLEEEGSAILIEQNLGVRRRRRAPARHDRRASRPRRRRRRSPTTPISSAASRRRAVAHQASGSLRRRTVVAGITAAALALRWRRRIPTDSRSSASRRRLRRYAVRER
jgi:hypothetical protein